MWGSYAQIVGIRVISVVGRALPVTCTWESTLPNWWETGNMPKRTGLEHTGYSLESRISKIRRRDTCSLLEAPPGRVEPPRSMPQDPNRCPIHGTHVGSDNDTPRPSQGRQRAHQPAASKRKRARSAWPRPARRRLWPAARAPGGQVLRLMCEQRGALAKSFGESRSPETARLSSEAAEFPAEPAGPRGNGTCHDQFT